jgi:hypothetical protein
MAAGKLGVYRWIEHNSLTLARNYCIQAWYAFLTLSVTALILTLYLICLKVWVHELKLPSFPVFTNVSLYFSHQKPY